MANPQDLKYTREHEWVRVSDDVGTFGITDFAQDQLGDIVFVELPPVGTQLRQMEKAGEIESVKAVSELFSPVSGKVVEVNVTLSDRPELVNESPYEDGWMVRVRLNERGELDKLLSVEEYDEFLAQEAG